MKKAIDSILHSGVVILLFLTLIVLLLNISGYEEHIQHSNSLNNSTNAKSLGLNLNQLSVGIFIVLSLLIATIYALLKNIKLVFNVVALFTLSGISYLSIIIFNQVPGNEVIVAPIIAFSLLFLAILKTINDKKTGKLTR